MGGFTTNSAYTVYLCIEF